VAETVANVLRHAAEERRVLLQLANANGEARAAIGEEAANDILSNVVLNAIEAAPDGGNVRVALRTSEKHAAFPWQMMGREFRRPTKAKCCNHFLRPRRVGRGWAWRLLSGGCRRREGRWRLGAGEWRERNGDSVEFSCGDEGAGWMKTVLIVDDEPASRYALRRALESRYRVVEADSAASGRSSLLSEKPDLLLLDVVLPGEDGLTFLKWLRREGYELPVLMVSALDTAKTAVEALQIGAADYLVKGFELEELRQRVANLLKLVGWRRKTKICGGAWRPKGNSGR